MKYLLSGIATAIIILSLDQMTKAAVLMRIETDTMAIMPFFNLVLVWNRGISFGMFNDHGGQAGTWMLIGVSLAIIAFFAAWLRRAENRALACAIGAVIGGAIGNIIDRVRFGAVVDFLDFHIGDLHWPAFNVADSAIVCGIAFVVLDGLFFEPKRKNATQES